MTTATAGKAEPETRGGRGRATAAGAGLATRRSESSLLVTKLCRPVVREQSVPRERLVERLRRGSLGRLTLLAAPAGSGKSTLLAEWGDQEEATRPVGWVSLDGGDNDAVVLWLHVIESLRRASPGVGDAALHALLGSADLIEVVLPCLVNELAEQPDVVLVLDDFHELSGGLARDSVAWFVDHAPASVQLVLATRREPDLPLAALRAHGELLELRARDLRFTRADAHALLNERMELGLCCEDVDALLGRTEGWPAGLYLAGLSLDALDAQERHGFVLRFDATNRNVLEFLVDEVFEAHDPVLQTLMLRVSILDRFCGPLCEALMEQDDATAMLHALSRSNLFVVPLDDRGEWFRFHQLFGHLLRLELAQREPEILPTLHGRASAWFRNSNLNDEAIDHALDAGAFDETADLIATAWIRYVDAARVPSLCAWLARIPRDVLGADVRLLLVQAWVSALSGERTAAVRAIEHVEQLDCSREGPLPDGFASVEASVTVLRAFLHSPDVGLRLESAKRATELEGPESPWRAVACWAAGWGHYFSSEPEEADRWLDEAAKCSRAGTHCAVVASALSIRSLIAGDRGDVEEQSRLAERAAGLVHERGLEEVNSWVHVAIGLSLAAHEDLEQGLTEVERGVAVARSHHGVIDLAEILIHQATLLRAAGEHGRATAVIAEIRSLLETCPDPGTRLPIALAALESPASKPAMRKDERVSERELRVLRLLSGTLSERDIARELYLSHNTVHTHTKAIYRKLGVRSRADAISRARRIGLLPSRGAPTAVERGARTRVS